ncbi:MAG: CPBP family intramembrane metalloprotease [Bdellovibrionales bacterium]|nr:CPBP family intramembrane metalloprotease [Bdellovibrionales bacterium]
MKKIIFLALGPSLFLFSSLPSTIVFAQSVPPKPAEAPPGKTDDGSLFDYQMHIRPGKVRSSTWWFPLLGYAAPGVPQYMNGQLGAGFVYSGISTGGFILNAVGSNNGNSDLALLGYKTYEVGGGLSAYHTFRSVVTQRKLNGDFDFLQTEEKSDDLMLAPFHFEYALRPTTFIPLAVLGAFLVYEHNYMGGGAGSLSLGEAALTSGVSYGAGVAEETMFRGWMMMNMRESWGSDFWSGFASGTIFGFAHYSEENKFPVPQLLVGYYLGWLTQHNDWTLSESIFMHTWWDIIAFASSFSQSNVDTVHWLPRLMITF